MASLEKITKKGSSAYRLTWYEDGLRKRLYLDNVSRTEVVNAKRLSKILLEQPR